MDLAPAPLADLHVSVVGPPGMTQDVVVALLEKCGAVLDLRDDASATVIVLVEPRMEHWRHAESVGLPTVVVDPERSSDDQLVESVMRGANAVVHQNDGGDELVAAVQVVAGGGVALQPLQVRAVLDATRARATSAPPIALTGREVDILGSIAAGRSVKQTARELGVSAKTIENLQSRLFRKLGARNRVQALVSAVALGIFEQPTTNGDLPVPRPS